MGMPADVHLRRVGFRTGSREELTALHSVEAPVAAERKSHRMPQPVEAYVAFAQNLPSQFDDHAWLADTRDGRPAAAGFCWSNSAGDDQCMECDLFVTKDYRRQGIGTRIAAVICREALHERRSLLTWSTYGAVPAGEAFSRRLGARIARLNRTSELQLADVDWALIERWALADRARALGYTIEIVEGAYPEHLRADAATFHHIMQTAPAEGLDLADIIIDARFVAELDRALAEAGRTRWTVLARDPAGRCVGGTEVTFEPGNSEAVLQQNTGIDPAHRRLGLARWAKAAMLQEIRRRRPEIIRIRTENAHSNAPMLAINDALGFKITSTRTEWQARAGDLLGAIH